MTDTRTPEQIEFDEKVNTSIAVLKAAASVNKLSDAGNAVAHGMACADFVCQLALGQGGDLNAALAMIEDMASDMRERAREIFAIPTN